MTIATKPLDARHPGFRLMLMLTRYRIRASYPTQQPGVLVTFVGMAAVFLVIAVVACWLPARRAAAIAPNVALRQG